MRFFSYICAKLLNNTIMVTSFRFIASRSDRSIYGSINYEHDRRAYSIIQSQIVYPDGCYSDIHITLFPLFHLDDVVSYFSDFGYTLKLL